MRRSSTRLYTGLLFCFVVSLCAASAHAQPDGAGLMTAGPLYVRALDGSGWGGELVLAGYLPLRFLSSTSALGPRFSVVALQQPNDWNRPVRMLSLGIRWRTHWNMFGGRLRPHVMVPAELLWTDAGVKDLVCYEAILRAFDPCQYITNSYGLAVGAGVGLEVRLLEGLALSGSVTTLMTTMNPNPVGTLWSGSFGVSMRVPNEA